MTEPTQPTQPPPATPEAPAPTTAADGDVVTPRSLAELARAGFSIVRQPLMRVAYEVHHVNDRAGYLSDLLRTPVGADAPSEADRSADEQLVERFVETLTTSAYGTGLVIGTRTVSAGVEHTSLVDAASPIQVTDKPGVVRWFSGLAVPNVSFTYDAAHVFDGLIAIGDADTRLAGWHARAILDVMVEIAHLAADIAKAPILSLQSPVQLPPQAYANRVGSDKWPTPSAVAVRFSIALHRPTAKSRLELLEHASEFCTKRGLAFWVADNRSGPRAGNWFEICPPAETRRDEFLVDAAADVASPPWSLPVTLVGPARVGAIRSVVRYLGLYQGAGVVACSMSIVDDVAFIHLHLTAATADNAGLSTLNDELDRITRQTKADGSEQFDPVQLLPSLLPALGAPFVPPPLAAVGECNADLEKRVGDFHLLVGHAKALPANLRTQRRALWLSWEVEGQEAELSVPFQALHAALHDLMPSWYDEDGSDDAPNIEYLICRRVRHAILRGKGKISLPDRLRRIVVTGDLHSDLAKLCEHIEEAWRARLSPTRRIRELTVSWRENWLGHWTSPLD